MFPASPARLTSYNARQVYFSFHIQAESTAIVLATQAPMRYHVAGAGGSGAYIGYS